MNMVSNPLKLILKCIKYAARAWNNVTNTTIENCWVKADILPNYNDEGMNDREDCKNCADIQLEFKRLKELEEVQVLIDKLVFENLLLLKNLFNLISLRPQEK